MNDCDLSGKPPKKERLCQGGVSSPDDDDLAVFEKGRIASRTVGDTTACELFFAGNPQFPVFCPWTENEGPSPVLILNGLDGLYLSFSKNLRCHFGNDSALKCSCLLLH